MHTYILTYIHTIAWTYVSVAREIVQDVCCYMLLRVCCNSCSAFIALDRIV